MIEMSRKSELPLYMQLYQQLRTEILSGVLKEGDVLTGSRVLAKTLQVSRNTVDNAYGQLAAEGYITAKRGVGYVVTKLPELELPEQRYQKSQNAGMSSKQPEQMQSMQKHTNQWKLDQRRSSQSSSDSKILYDLTNSSYTSDLFPRAMWKKFTLEGLDYLSREEKISAFLDKQGEYELRHNLMLYLERIRGVHCEEEQIIITAGIQQSLEYICKLLGKEYTTLYMEEPGYQKSAAVFQNNGWNIHSIGVDQDGLRVSDLPLKTDASAIYTTPSHQFPTGVTMPIGRRMQLLEWANQNRSYIIEDDFDSELRYYAKPIPSLQSIDGNHRVIYLGTFSKAMSPSVRMGYMILPHELLEKYRVIFHNYNSTVPLLNQYVISRIIETGEYDRHVRRLNHTFRKRLEQFSKEFAEMDDKIRITGNGTGQFFLMQFPPNVNQQDLIDLAMKQGVRVYPTMQFWQEKADCPPNSLFLGFSKIDQKDITDCANRLKKAWKNIF